MPQRNGENSRLLPESKEVVWDALVFQGGGALGAYECGAYEALAGAGFDFDVVAGVSVGAANAAIVASRGPDAVTYLRRFWDDLEDPSAEFTTPSDPLRRQLSAWKSACMGNPRMFMPRWVSSPWSLPGMANWVNLYDPSPYAKLLERHVDFAALRHSPRRLIVTAVDIESGELVSFDSSTTAITCDHIVASGAIPPAFPPVRIGGRFYWDGGILSNTPARMVLHTLPPDDLRRLVLIELFGRHHHVPRSLQDVLGTMKDLTYMDKLEEDTRKSRADQELREVLNQCLAALSPKERARMQGLPQFVSVLNTHRHHVDLFLLSHTDDKGELNSKDYDFSPTSLRRHRQEGQQNAKEAIRKWEQQQGWVPFGSSHRKGDSAPRPAGLRKRARSTP